MLGGMSDEIEVEEHFHLQTQCFVHSFIHSILYLFFSSCMEVNCL